MISLLSTADPGDGKKVGFYAASCLRISVDLLLFEGQNAGKECPVFILEHTGCTLL